MSSGVLGEGIPALLEEVKGGPVCFHPEFLEEGSFSGLADICLVVGFLLPYGIGVFLGSAAHPDEDSSMKICLMKTITSEFPALLGKGWPDIASGMCDVQTSPSPFLFFRG